MHPIELLPLRRAFRFKFELSRLFAGLASLGLALLLPACKPRELQALLQPSQALASVVAAETLRLAGPNKQIALITHDASWGPPSVAEQALRDALKKQGATVFTAKAASLGDPMTSGQIGLKADDFFEALEKSKTAGAVISLVGAPMLKDGDVARVRPDHPPVVVIATASLGDKMGVHGDQVQLARLLEAKTIQLAIVDGADSAAPPSAQADPARELFNQHFHILRRPD